MKIFLFLFPIHAYVNPEPFLGICSDYEKLLAQGDDPGRINALIHARYRERDYKVTWVLFSKPEMREEPDVRLVSQLFTLSDTPSLFALSFDEDVVITCGVTFKEHFRDRWYPNPTHILSQLPGPIEHLVVGGFHLWNEIDKVAEHAHARGLNVFVDEDCTERFFSRTIACGTIPLHQTREEQAVERLKALEGSDFFERARKRRRSRPWLVQI